MAEKFANNFQTTIVDGGDGIDSSQTTIGLGDAPPAALAGGQWRLLVESEIILVTAFSGSSITACTRGAEGTTPAAHAETTAATNILTAGAIGEIGGSPISSGAYVSLPAAGTAGRIYLPTDSPHSLLRDDGANWEHFLAGVGKATLPVSGDFAWVNQGGATVTAERGIVRLYGPGGAAINLRIRKKSHSASKKYSVVVGGNIYDDNQAAYHVGFRNSANSRVMSVGIRNSAALGVFKYNNETSYNSEPFGQLCRPYFPGGFLCLQVEDDDTNVYFRYSPDGGISWFTLYSEDRTTFITPDEVCYWVNCNNAAQRAYLVIYSWKEE